MNETFTPKPRVSNLDTFLKCSFLKLFFRDRLKKLLLIFFLLSTTLDIYAQWTELTPPPFARYEGPSVVKDGKIYVFGGFGPGYSIMPQLTVYDPALDTWTQLADIPIAVTHIRLALVNNNEVWVAGGRLWNDDQVNDIQVYNIATNSWSAGPSLPEPRGAGVLALVNNEMHYISGFGPKPAVVDFDDHWALDMNNQEAGWQTRAPLPFTRHHSGTGVIGNKIYVVGGQIDHDNTARDNAYVHSYDPITDTWTQETSLPASNSHIEPSTFAYGGKVIMVGGEIIREKIYEYDPVTKIWTQVLTLPVGLLAPSGKIINGKIYVSHGATGGGFGNPTVPTQKAYVADYTFGTPNNPPSFNIGGNQTVVENSGFQTVPGFAYNINDNDGGTQSLTFYVNSDNPGLFATQPAIDATNGNLTFTPAANTVGTVTVSVTLSDGIGSSATQQFTITVSGGGGGSPGSVLYRINCGGSEMADTPINWAEDKITNPSPYLNADQSNNTGGWDGFGGTNSTTIPGDIFGSRRWDGPWNDEMRWSFPLSNGEYEVRLYFVEYDNANGVGNRVFDVDVEGNTVLSNFDPYAEVGYNVGFQKTIFASVGDGVLNIDLLRQVGVSDDPAISAIEILSVQNGGVFPVEFTAFEAKHINRIVQLKWETEQEENLSHFEIERSLDSRNFQSLGQVKIAKVMGSNSYQYNDSIQMLNTFYYRIKAVDFDGTATYTSIREVKMDVAVFEVFPNPTKDRLNLRVNGKNGQVTVRMTHIGGLEVMRQELSLSGSLEHYSFELKGIPAGIYLFSFTQNGIKQIQKIFVR